MTIIIYGAAASSFVRTVRMAAHEKGLDYELGQVGDGTVGALGSPDHRKLHPFGKIPVFTDGKVTLWESMAICRYIDEAYEGKALQPGDVLERARMEQWISAGLDYVIPQAIRNFAQQYVFPSGPDGQPDMAKINEAKPKIREAMLVMDKELDGRTWLAGDNVSIADLLFAPVLTYVGQMPDGMEAFDGCQNLYRWWEAVSALESYKATVPDGVPGSATQAAE